MLNHKEGLHHLAFIMDGNRRWAKNNKKPIEEGHKAGLKNMASLLEKVFELKIPFVSVYAFSLDNWSRDPIEVKNIHAFIKEFYNSNIVEYKKRKIRIYISGVKDFLEQDVLEYLDKIQEETAEFTDSILNICFNYSGRREIIEATKRIVEDVKINKFSIEDLDIKSFKRYLFFPNIPDVDLLIRTSNEYRVSDFLTYEAVYAEYYFTDVLWPDLSISDVNKAIENFYTRKRRFGGS